MSSNIGKKQLRRKIIRFLQVERLENNKKSKKFTGKI